MDCSLLSDPNEQTVKFDGSISRNEMMKAEMEIVI